VAVAVQAVQNPGHVSRRSKAMKRRTLLACRPWPLMAHALAGLWAWLGLMAACTAQPAGPPYTVCADPDPPPWVYWQRDARGRPTERLLGSSIDLVSAAFERMKLPVRFIGDQPWARCLRSVQAGEIDFALGAYRDAARERQFAYSVHYNTLTPQVYYSRRKPIKVQGVADLKAYRGCGMLGASYAHYGLSDSQLDLGVNNYPRLIAKLKAGRCDYFVEELEVISSYKLLGTDLLADPDIERQGLPGAQAPAKHLVTSLKGRGQTLLPRLNEALQALIDSGQAAVIWTRHAGDMPYRP
jgi:polar amino acid transport system substrate-binding protein